MSFWNSPNGNEPGHLAAGVYTLRFGRTDLYRVNPPLIRTIAAIPATYFFNIDADWLSTASNVLTMRPEYEVGNSLYFKNDPSKLRLAFFFGRLMLLPFTLLGAWVCYVYAKELFGTAAAFCSFVFWSFNPYVLTWAATINPEIGSTSLGILVFYLFWHWCRNNNWKNTLYVGISVGFLLAAKTIWIIIFPLFPILWIVSFHMLSGKNGRYLFEGGIKLAIVFVVALTVLNALYNLVIDPDLD